MSGVRPERPVKVGREDNRLYCVRNSTVHPPDCSLFNHANLRPHIFLDIFSLRFNHASLCTHIFPDIFSLRFNHANLCLHILILWYILLGTRTFFSTSYFLSVPTFDIFWYVLNGWMESNRVSINIYLEKMKIPFILVLADSKFHFAKFAYLWSLQFNNSTPAMFYWICTKINCCFRSNPTFRFTFKLWNQIKGIWEWTVLLGVKS